MVTRGDRPVCWLRRGGTLQRLAVPQVAAIDTTGAGDVFHAALALAIGEGRAERTAVAFAATAAALKCLGGPGVLGAPARNAVERRCRPAPPARGVMPPPLGRPPACRRAGALPTELVDPAARSRCGLPRQAAMAAWRCGARSGATIRA